MKPFHTYRDGLPPGPGIFSTAESVDRKGKPLQIGDIVSDSMQLASGVVVGIYNDLIVFLVDEPDKDDELGYFTTAIGVDDLTIVGHAENVLAEIARIEAEATGRRLK